MDAGRGIRIDAICESVVEESISAVGLDFVIVHLVDERLILERLLDLDLCRR
jgi:hypothetical protein